MEGVGALSPARAEARQPVAARALFPATGYFDAAAQAAVIQSVASGLGVPVADASIVAITIKPRGIAVTFRVNIVALSKSRNIASTTVATITTAVARIMSSSVARAQASTSDIVAALGTVIGLSEVTLDGEVPPIARVTPVPAGTTASASPSATPSALAGSSAGAIGGGVAGGVVCLLGGALCVAWWLGRLPCCPRDSAAKPPGQHHAPAAAALPAEGVLIAEVPAAPLVFSFPVGPPAIALAGAASPLPEALVEGVLIAEVPAAPLVFSESDHSAIIAVGAAGANAGAADAIAGSAAGSASVGASDANADASCNREPALPHGGVDALERVTNAVKDSFFEDDVEHDAGVTVRLPERYADATFF